VNYLLADRTNVQPGNVTDQIRKQVCRFLEIQLSLTHLIGTIKLLKGEEVGIKTNG
jgi:hypothetical protein